MTDVIVAPGPTIVRKPAGERDVITAAGRTIVVCTTGRETVTRTAPERIIVTAPGTQGPPGPTGPAGASAGTVYEYVRTVPAATWVITHGLGRRVSVTLLNDTYEAVYADIDENGPPWNTITVTYPTPVTGSALIL